MKTHMGCIKNRIISGILVAFVLALLNPFSVQAQGPSLGKSSKETNDVYSSNPKLNKELKSILEATKKYRNIDVALKDGYIRDPMNMCEEGPDMGLPSHVGAMGIHYFKPDLLGITGDKPRVNGTGTYTDFKKPGILIYEPQADGSMELVAVENLVFVDAWHKKHGKNLPEFMGYEYFNMTDNPETEVDEAHMFAPHYDLHVWLFRDNPNGIFTPFNPNVTCEHHKPDVQKGKKMDQKKNRHKMDKGNH